MPKSKIILALGFFIALLPLLGFPHSWESFLQIVSGLGIVLLSVMISVDKRLTQKAKAERRQVRRRTQIDVETGLEVPVYGRRLMRMGRRASDVVPVNVPPANEADSNPESSA